MIMSAVLAVALNAVPVMHQPQSLTARGQQLCSLVRDVHQTVDRRGDVHLVGHDKANRAFDLKIYGNGDVEGSVGAWDVSFHAVDAS
jgi:hypothetical protein